MKFFNIRRLKTNSVNGSNARSYIIGELNLIWSLIETDWQIWPAIYDCNLCFAISVTQYVAIINGNWYIEWDYSMWFTQHTVVVWFVLLETVRESDVLFLSPTNKQGKEAIFYIDNISLFGYMCGGSWNMNRGGTFSNQPVIILYLKNFMSSCMFAKLTVTFHQGHHIALLR